MALPVLMIASGAALVALVGAGAAEKAKASAGMSANTPTNVAPTQQSTGGTNGGAQDSSHSDFAGGPTGDAGGTAQPSTGGSAATAANVESMFGNPAPQGDIASGTGPGFAVALDPWQPAPGPSVTAGPIDPMRSILGLGAVTVKSASQAFSTLGASLGAVW